MKNFASALTCCACLLACAHLSAAEVAASPLEGKWIGTAGKPGNEAVIGLEIKPDARGALTACLTLDQLNFYGAPLQRFEPAGPDKFKAPDFGLEVEFEHDHVVARFSGDNTPMHLRRTDHLPPEPVVPADLPKGPGPRWQVKLGAPIYAAAAVHAGQAYVGTTGGVFHAVNIADGRLAWTFSAGRPMFGEALATEDAVYFACDNGYLFKLNRADGKELWRYDLGDAQVPRILPHPAVYDYDYQSPCPVLADGVLYVGSGNGSFHAVNATDGRRVWRIESKGKIRADAAVAGERVFFGTGDGLICAVDRATGRELWKKSTGAPVTSAPVLMGDRLIIGGRDSVLKALQPDTGEPLWRLPFWGSYVESTAAPADGLFYLGSSDLRRVGCYDPKDGRIVWRTDVFGWAWGRPLVGANTVYLGTAGANPYMIRHVGGLCALDRATGRLLWRWPVAEPVGQFAWGFAASPAPAGDALVIGGLDGTLYAFPTR